MNNKTNAQKPKKVVIVKGSKKEQTPWPCKPLYSGL